MKVVYKLHHWKVLLSSFYLIGHTLGLHKLIVTITLYSTIKVLLIR